MRMKRKAFILLLLGLFLLILGCSGNNAGEKKDGKIKLDRQFYMKNPHNDMELYIGGITNRFAAFTGNIIEDKPLRECTAAVLTTLDKNMRRKEKTKYSAKRDGNRDDFDIVCNLRKQKNGAKFKKLYDGGDFSDYGSQ